MINQILRKILAFALVFSFCTSFLATAAFAEDTTDKVVVDGQSMETFSNHYDNVTVTNDSPAVEVKAGYYDAECIISGNVSVTSDAGNAVGVSAAADDDDIATVTVKGDVTANSTAESTAASTNAIGISAEGEEYGSVEVTVTGNVSAVSEAGIATGVKAENHANSVKSENGLNISVNGNVSAEGELGSWGLEVSADEGKAAVTVKDVTATSTTNTALGLFVSSDEGAAATVTVNDVTAKGGTTSRGLVTKAADSDGSTTVTVNNVTVTGTDSYGLTAEAESGGSTTVTVNNVTVTGNDSAVGLTVNAEGGKATVVVEGDASATGGEEGIGLELKGAGESDVLVKGTLSGSTAAIACDAETAPDANITVGAVKGDVAEALAAAVNYIVKWLNPDAGSLTVTKEDGSALEQSHDLPVAHEGDKIRLNVTVPEGYELKSAQNEDVDGTKTDLAKDDKGFFFVVKRTGVYLSALLEKIAPDAPGDDPSGKPSDDPSGKPSDDPSDKPAEETAAAGAETAGIRCRFDLDGGSLDGETGTVTRWYSYGFKQPLPEAPVKDGASFAGWQTTVDGETVIYDAGDALVFTAPMDFVALWK